MRISDWSSDVCSSDLDPHPLLDLCFRLLDGAQIMPYYFYMCDMIPFSEHWRVSVADAQRLQHHIMGYLPGFATHRIVCDVTFVGKGGVHKLALVEQGRGVLHPGQVRGGNKE